MINFKVFFLSLSLSPFSTIIQKKLQSTLCHFLKKKRKFSFDIKKIKNAVIIVERGKKGRVLQLIVYELVCRVFDTYCFI